MNFKAKVYFISILTASVSIALVIYGLYVIKGIESAENIWHTHQIGHVEYTRKLNAIRSHLGYGGFIHNYKNYLIRKDKKLIPIIEQNKKDVIIAIEEYKKLSLSTEQTEALLILEKVFREYEIKFDVIRSMLNQGYDTSIVDSKVKVDDAPAITAIKILIDEAAVLSLQEEDESIVILDDILKQAYWGILFVFAIIISGMGVVYYLVLLIKNNVRLEQVKEELNTFIDSAPDALLIIDSSGDIMQSNIQASKLFLYAKDELKGMSVDKLVPERYRDKHKGQRDGYIKKPHYRVVGEQAGLVAVDKNNKEIPIEIALNYIERQDEIIVIAEIRDITERQRTEDQLRIQKIILDEMAEGVNLVNTEGIIIYTNPRFNSIFGYQYGELIGEHASILNADSEPKKSMTVAHEIINSVEKNGLWSGEVHNIRKNGKEFWTLASVSKMNHREYGEVLVTVQQDISSEKEAKLEAEESRDFVSTVVASLDGNIAVIDNQGDIIAVNEAWEKFSFQHNLVTLQGIDVGENYFAACEKAENIKNDPSVENALLGIRQVLSGYKKSFDIEYQYKSSNAQGWFKMVVLPLKRKEGGAVISHYDVTDRLAVKDALRKSETSLRNINDAVPVLIVYIDKNHKMIYANKVFENWYGVPRQKFIGKYEKDIIGEDVAEAIKPFTDRVLAGERISFEQYIKFKYGPARYVRASFIPNFNEQLEVDSYFIVADDITQRHQEEEIRLENEREQKNTLVREVHHRIKNNLQSVIGMLRRESDKHKDLKPYIDEAIGHVNAISIVHGIQGVGSLNHILITELISNIINSLRNVTKSNIEYINKLNENVNYQVSEEEAVPTALIINELLTNAVKHNQTDNGDNLISVALYNKDNEVVFEIQNIDNYLPDEFSLQKDHMLGMGLKLVKSLLPEKGASVKISDNKFGVLTEMVLKEPVLHAKNIM